MSVLNSTDSQLRPDNRKPNQLRPTRLTPHWAMHAEGSVLVEAGSTKVLCTASVEDRVPTFLRGTGKGWITSEYGMLPRSTNTRIDREASKGKQSGRTQEIQRLIGRSLRQSLNLKKLSGVMITVDCDVLNADGGTRTASISGAYIATYLALKNHFGTNPNRYFKNQVAAVSAGLVNGNQLLDLDYIEDSQADFDMNLVLNQNLDIIEIQGTSEKEIPTLKILNSLISLATEGIRNIIFEQNKIIEEINNS